MKTKSGTKKKARTASPEYRGRRRKPTAAPPQENLLTQFLEQAKKSPESPALLGSHHSQTTPISYRDLADRVEKLCCGLRKLGIRKGDRVAILSENRAEWAIADFSIMALGAVTVPIYNTLSPQQMAYQLKHSRSKLLFASDAPHLQSLRTVRQESAHLKRTVFFAPQMPDGFGEPDLLLGDLMELGQANRKPLEELVQRITQDDPATIVYTAGTSSQWPKGALLTHRNFLAEKRALEGVLRVQEGDILMSFLPLAHILQRVVDTITLLAGGAIAYCTDIDAVPDLLRVIRPHLFVGVPRTYEKIRNIILENLFYSAAPLNAVYQRLFQWMETTHALEKEGKRVRSVMDMPFHWMSLAAVRLIRERIGGRIRYCFCAGAPLPRELEAFFEIIQIPLFNVYGMTELTGAVSANLPDRHRSGTVGVPLPGCEIRIAEDGEVLIRGDLVMTGYYRPGKPPETRTDPEGWFPTGDIGHLDEDGFLVLTGRKKQLLITAAGKNIPPQPIESRLRRHPLIQQAMVVGDGRKYLTALLVPSFQKLDAFATRERILYLDRTELLEHPKIQNLYEGMMGSINRELSRFETLKKFTLVPDRFSQENGELTPTNRLRRNVIERHYRKEIESMYWGET